MDEVSDGRADAKAALLLIQVLILSLLEARVVEGEVLRRIADDALTSEIDIDPAAMTQIVLHLNRVIQDSYAAQPIIAPVADAGAPSPGGDRLI